ncbi:MAG: class I SAM-dependent methyltransferase [Leptolyngbyaceae cyanobacterium CRU_2_3]|nr:class I SAM-dependent methyltransferase [Leptolyngbyaceae cyanobacterium CRU_2_3]
MLNPTWNTQTWDTARYEQQHSFVWQYGESLLDLLSPQPGEQILDLGCGTGQLTEKIAARGAIAQGIDASPAMIERAQQSYPQLRFAVADARNFQVDVPLDAVFSNAVLHWIPEAEAVITCIRQALKPGGRFVAEFGGQGNVQGIVRALEQTLVAIASPQAPNPWYFPSIGEYTTCLEQQGFTVIYAALFDRPTPLESGTAGLANWLQMFASSFLSQLSASQQQQAIRQVEQQLRPSHFQNDTWIADYRRIRVIATLA